MKWSSFLVMLLAKFTLFDVSVCLDLRTLELHWLLTPKLTCCCCLFLCILKPTSYLFHLSQYPFSFIHLLSITFHFFLHFLVSIFHVEKVSFCLTVSVFHLNFLSFFFHLDLDSKDGNCFLSALWRYHCIVFFCLPSFICWAFSL